MNIIGINALHCDLSAALVCDAHLMAVLEEERFLRVKRWAGSPSPTTDWGLCQGGLVLGDVHHIAVS